MTAAGRQPTSPATLNAQIISLAQQFQPGLTASLPGSLIDDVSGTDTAALVLMDESVTELVNSLTPFGANLFLLLQLGAVYGVPQGQASRNSVYLVFSGSVGFPVPVGFTVSDGTHQYVVQDGGIVGSGGSSGPLFAIATDTGSWAIPANTVTSLATSVPSTITLSVTNPLAGLPGAAAQSAESYRSDVLEAGQAISQGMTTMLKTALRNVAGVQQNLVSVRKQPLGWEVIVGGGDPYQVGNAIFRALFWLPGLVGSVLQVTNITQANPGVVTTDLNHGYAVHQAVELDGVVGMTAVNGVAYTVAASPAPTEKTFALAGPGPGFTPINTSGFGAYVSGGVSTPNLRNVVVAVKDYPDVYLIPFVVPPQQTVAIDLLWNTSSGNLVSGASVAALGGPALVNYVNNLPVGQPMNLFDMQRVFSAAIAQLVPPPLLTRMAFTVSINGVSTSVVSGTGTYPSDPESYLFATTTSITISQG